MPKPYVPFFRGMRIGLTIVLIIYLFMLLWWL